MTTHLFGKELFIRVTVRVFCVRGSNCVCALLSLLLLSVGFGCINFDHFFSIYFKLMVQVTKRKCTT